MKDIGKTIKSIHEVKGLRQQQIAKQVNTHIYSRVEAGDDHLSLDGLNKIARYIGMTIVEPVILTAIFLIKWILKIKA